MKTKNNNDSSPKKIAVLTSGGVDSSVALMLLKEQGYAVTAFYLKIWLEDEIKYLSDCPWEEDLKYIREICERENIPLHIINMQKEYFDTVVDYTLSEVKAGRTPNPDVMCNNRIKFGLFLNKIEQHQKQYGGPFDKIATGHYAKIEEEDGIAYLKIAPDPIKDQTYFLSHLRQNQLKKLIFPLGNFTKKAVRELANKYNLPNKDRKDSQGICFLGKFKYSEFIKHYLGEKKGDIIDYDSDQKLGEHEGFWYYTIGQRKGIKLSGGPYYVVAKDTAKNIVYVSNNYFSEDKKRNTVRVGELNWNTGLTHKPDNQNLRIKIRHGEHYYKCEIIESTPAAITLQLDSSDQGIAPGQFVAFYSGDICLGSGVITK